jgi:hypothetical protein
MQKSKKILLKFMIVLVTLICADNGRSFVIAGNSIQIILNHHNDINSEETHHSHFPNLNDVEKWAQTDKPKISNSDITLLSSVFDSECPSGKFSDSVWQPPKLIIS